MLTEKPAATVGRAPSPNSISDPRPSTSSNRSFRRTEQDFEQALLNPGQTLFLSASPGLEEGAPATPPRAGVDREAPAPIEKRSYEDDLKAQSFKTPTKARPGEMRSPAVIPPTPPSQYGEKRMSQGTMRSEGSNGSTMSTGRGSVGSANRHTTSLGIDGEHPRQGKGADGSRDESWR